MRDGQVLGHNRECGKARVTRRRLVGVGAGEGLLEPGLVEAAEHHLVLLAVPDHLGQREGGRHEVADREGEEGLDPRVGRQVVDGHQDGEESDAEGDDGLM